MINPVQDITPDGRPMEGTAYPEHSALGVSLDSGLREGMLSLELLQQSVLNTSLVARHEAGIMTSDWKPVINPVQDITPDGRPMEGTAYPEHLALGASLDSGLTQGGDVEHRTSAAVVFNTLSHNWKQDSIRKSQIGSRLHFRFQALPWMVDLGRGILARSIRLWGCPWTVDSWRVIRGRSHDLMVEAERNSQTGMQTGMRWRIRFWTLTWTVDLWRGILTWSHWLWGCLWTVDSWRGCRVRNHWNSQCSERCLLYDWMRRHARASGSGIETTNSHVLNRRRGRCWILIKLIIQLPTQM